MAFFMLNMMNHGILGGLIWWVESTENRGFYQWKKGVSGKSSSSIHPILVGDKSPLLEVYFASETMIFVGHPPF